MGLIVDAPITVHTQTRVCTDGSSSSGYEDTGSFDMTLYRVFSMQDDMKTLQVPSAVKNEFDRFIDTAIKKTNSEAYESSFDNLDEYLGTIGVSNEMC